MPHSPLGSLQAGRGLPSVVAAEGIAGVNRTRSGKLDSEAYSRKKFYRIDLLLTTVRAEVRFPIAGTLIWAADSTLSTDLAQIRLDTLENAQIPFRPGTQISGAPFKEIFISNAGQAGSTMTIIIAVDSPGDRIDTET